MAQNSTVTSLISKLNADNIVRTLTTFSEFHNRFYKSPTGQESSEWLLKQVQAVIAASGAKNVNVRAFNHSFVQSSVIATIPGKSAKTIVVSAHQDSVNLSNPTSGRAPGAGKTP
jgi:bacterial leucyl aminopeptidase